MTAQLPYIKTRNGVYQYERRVPVHIQRDSVRFASAFGSRPLFRVSLRTKRRDEAALAYRSIDQRFEKLAGESNRAHFELVARDQPQRELTDHDLKAITERYSAITAEPFERLHRHADVCPTAAAELTRMHYELEQDADALRAVIRERGDVSDSLIVSPKREAASLIEEQGFFAPEGSELRGAITGAIRAGLEQGYSRINDLEQGNVAPRLGTALTPLEPVKTFTLADAVDGFFEGRALSVKLKSETRLALRQFEQVSGRKALASITKSEVLAFVDSLAATTVGGKTAESVVRQLSPATIGKRLRVLSTAVETAIDRANYSGTNPFSNVRLSRLVQAPDPNLMPDKRRFQVSEVNAVFCHPWFTGCASPTDRYTPGQHRLTGSEFWVPIVALFTGCRASELGGLKIEEVKIDNRFPHIVVKTNEYRRTKNKKPRYVPILDALIGTGFLRYVERIRKSGHDRVFPDWTAEKRNGAGPDEYPAWSNSGVIRAFNRNVIDAALGDCLSAKSRREVTFHSFRGAFKALLATNKGIPPVVYNHVVGHKQDELDERYIGAVHISESYPLVHTCNYKDLELPSPPTLWE